MTNLMSIELNKKVAEVFLEDSGLVSFLMQYTDAQPLKLPTKKVELKLYNYLSSVEQIKKDLAHLLALANEQQKAIAMKAFQDYVDSDIVITYNQIDDGQIKVSAKTLFTHELFGDDSIIRFIYTSEGCEVEYWSGMSGNIVQGQIVASKMMGLLYTVLSHMDKPTTVKTVSKTKTLKTNTKRQSKGKKKSKVRYVYKTIYKVSNVNIGSDSNTVKRHPSKEREYFKEEWQRRGHYRTYRNKETGEVTKEVWIKPTTCRAKGKVKQEQQYKITKL